MFTVEFAEPFLPIISTVLALILKSAVVRFVTSEVPVVTISILSELIFVSIAVLATVPAATSIKPVVALVFRYNLSVLVVPTVILASPVPVLIESIARVLSLELFAVSVKLLSSVASMLIAVASSVNVLSTLMSKCALPEPEFTASRVRV